MIITTTNNLEKYSIKEYLGIVNANVVIGVNLFSDYAASLTDVFGGHSDTFQNKLNSIYQEVMNKLEGKADRLNADAILGLHIDFDELSAAGKSMFMVSASGTAVQLEDTSKDRYELYKKLNEIHEYFTKGFLSKEEYDYEKKLIMKEHSSPISTEVKLIKEKEEQEARLLREKEEMEIRKQEVIMEEERKTFKFGTFKE